MSNMFDFNEDRKTDTGERFIGYEIYKEVTGGNGSPVSAKKLDGFTIFIILLIAWQVLNWIADLLY